MILTHSVRVDGFEIEQISLSENSVEVRQKIKNDMAKRLGLHPRQIMFVAIRHPARPLIEIVKQIALTYAHNKQRLYALYQEGVISEDEYREAIEERK